MVFHELGHFWAARFFNVKAEAFSVGFGPVLFKKQIGETEWRLSLIPMGGYVKLLGEEPGQELSEEEKKRALHAAAPWKRFWIFAAGPLFNFILAVFVFMLILVLGEPQVSSVAGRVVEGSYAEKIGFRSGDEVQAIDGEKIKSFREMILKINAAPSQVLDFKVNRNKAMTSPQSKNRISGWFFRLRRK